MSDDITQIKISTARIEEQVKALASATNVQYQTLSEQMEGLAGKQHLSDLEARVLKMEANHSWVVRGVIATGATVIATAMGLTKKIGL